MATMTLREYAEQQGACSDGIAWLGNRDLPAMWAECQRSDWMAWLLLKLDWDDANTQREYAWWCASQVRHLMTDQRSVDCLDVVRSYLDGAATDSELDAAWDAAWAAAGDAAGDAAAWAAAGDAAAWAAARAAARAAAWDAAWAAAGAAQADRLRELVPLPVVQALFDETTAREQQK